MGAIGRKMYLAGEFLNMHFAVMAGHVMHNALGERRRGKTRNMVNRTSFLAVIDNCQCSGLHGCRCADKAQCPAHNLVSLA